MYHQEYKMDSLAEYNELMAKAGMADIAEELQQKHKPDLASTKVVLPDDMLTASEYAKRIYIRNKRYRDSHATRQYLMAYRAERQLCECGCIISKPNIKSHQRSAKCRNKLKVLALTGKVHDRTRLAWGVEEQVPQPQPPQQPQPSSQPVHPPLP